MDLAAADAALNGLAPAPFPLPLGDLAPVVEGVFTGLEKTDWVVCSPRERVGAVLRGCAVERLVNGFGGARPYHVAPSSEAPGARALHAVGLAVASGGPVACLLGPASLASGAFYEALNAALLLGAPVVFVAATRTLGDDAPVGRQNAASPLALAQSMGIAASAVKADANAITKAVKKARGTLHLLEIAL